MKFANPPALLVAVMANIILISVLLACSKKSTPLESMSPGTHTSRPNLTDARRLSEGGNKLTDAMSKPKTSFHFSFQGQENVSDKYTRDKTLPPEIGPVTQEADISPEEIKVTEMRGSTTRTIQAKKGDDLNWAMANLATLGAITSPNFVIAVGASVTGPPSADLVKTIPVDKFVFDTTMATATQKIGLDAARRILTTLKECKGTAWISKDSGILIKFDLDADYLDQNGHAWREHYEGEVTPQ
ncbi:MAG TPA: hypothetical protein VMO17_01640 [Terriglobia bacterium]|nr:hypothetical protein [Terriglobia bacterium]